MLISFTAACCNCVNVILCYIHPGRINWAQWLWYLTLREMAELRSRKVGGQNLHPNGEVDSQHTNSGNPAYAYILYKSNVTVPHTHSWFKCFFFLICPVSCCYTSLSLDICTFFFLKDYSRFIHCWNILSSHLYCLANVVTQQWSLFRPWHQRSWNIVRFYPLWWHHYVVEMYCEASHSQVPTFLTHCTKVAYL